MLLLSANDRAVVAHGQSAASERTSIDIVLKAVREDLPMARATKARTDVQTIATAINTYRVTCGTLPESLQALTTQTTVSGAPCGPVLGSIPAPPAG